MHSSLSGLPAHARALGFWLMPLALAAFLAASDSFRTAQAAAPIPRPRASELVPVHVTPPDHVDTFGISSRGNYLAITGSEHDNRIKQQGESRVLDIWDLSKGKRSIRIPLPSPVHRGKEKIYLSLSGKRMCAFSPDEKTVFLNMNRYQNPRSTYVLLQFDVTTGKLLSFFELREGHYPLALTPDGKTLVAGSYFEAIAFYDLKTGKETGVLKGPEKMFSRDKSLAEQSKANQGRDLSLRAEKVQLSDDGKYLVMVGRDQRIHVWDIAAGKRLWDKRYSVASEVTAYAISPDGKQFVTRHNTGFDKPWLRFHDMQTGKDLSSVYRPKGVPRLGGEIPFMAWLADGKTLLLGHRLNRVGFVFWRIKDAHYSTHPYDNIDYTLYGTPAEFSSDRKVMALFRRRTTTGIDVWKIKDLIPPAKEWQK